MKPANSEEAIISIKYKINIQWIIPYNAKLLLLFDCHLNVEIASTVKIYLNTFIRDQIWRKFP